MKMKEKVLVNLIFFLSSLFLFIIYLEELIFKLRKEIKKKKFEFMKIPLKN